MGGQAFRPACSKWFPRHLSPLSLQSGDVLERGCHSDPEQAGRRGTSESAHPLIKAREVVEDGANDSDHRCLYSCGRQKGNKPRARGNFSKSPLRAGAQYMLAATLPVLLPQLEEQQRPHSIPIALPLLRARLREPCTNVH